MEISTQNEEPHIAHPERRPEEEGDIHEGGECGNGRLAAKLDRLFEIVHPRDRGPYSPKEVSEALERHHGLKVSHTYVWQLRTGRRDNPTLRHLEAIAAFFKVPVAYFLDDAVTAEYDRQLDVLAALRDTRAQSILMRSVGLSDQGAEAVLAVLDEVRRREGLQEGNQ
ncbi:helix-turn-helix domain-containing protein [Streptomyces sp. NPDC003860]